MTICMFRLMLLFAEPMNDTMHSNGLRICTTRTPGSTDATARNLASDACRALSASSSDGSQVFVVSVSQGLCWDAEKPISRRR